MTHTVKRLARTIYIYIYICIYVYIYKKKSCYDCNKKVATIHSFQPQSIMNLLKTVNRFIMAEQKSCHDSQISTTICHYETFFVTIVTTFFGWKLWIVATFLLQSAIMKPTRIRIDTWKRQLFYSLWLFSITHERYRIVINILCDYSIFSLTILYHTRKIENSHQHSLWLQYSIWLFNMNRMHE